MKRVMVMGGPGSGKSTLARRLGDVTGLPVFHMDVIHWMPGWRERDHAEKVELALDIERRDAWIFEGGLSATYAHRASRADTLIWLDLPVLLRFWRVLKRRWVYRGGRTRPDLPENCPEQIDWEFVTFILGRRRHKSRARVADVARSTPDLVVHHLRSVREVRAFLRSHGAD